MLLQLLMYFLALLELSSYAALKSHMTEFWFPDLIRSRHMLRTGIKPTINLCSAGNCD